MTFTHEPRNGRLEELWSNQKRFGDFEDRVCFIRRGGLSGSAVLIVDGQSIVNFTEPELLELARVCLDAANDIEQRPDGWEVQT